MSDSQITVNLTLIQVCLKLVFLIQLFIKMICESKMQKKSKFKKWNYICSIRYWAERNHFDSNICFNSPLDIEICTKEKFPLLGIKLKNFTKNIFVKIVILVAWFPPIFNNGYITLRYKDERCLGQNSSIINKWSWDHFVYVYNPQYWVCKRNVKYPSI